MPNGVAGLRGILFGVLLGLTAAGLVLLVAGRPSGEPVTLLPAPSPMPIQVHVTGAVVEPGVYALVPGSLLQDALAAAGGASDDADLDVLNLAQPLVHGVRIVVPTRPTPLPPTSTPDPSAPPATPSSTPAPTGASAQTSPSGPININTATAAELETLPRIGPAMAQRILEYRSAHGPFLRIEDIQNVPGIGPATFEKLKDLITVQ